MGGYIIKNATVVTVDPNLGTILNCDVLIEGSNIIAVGPSLRTPKHDYEVINGTNTIVAPGFIDTHRHTWQTQLRTITTDFVLSDYVLALRHIYGSSYNVRDAYLGNLCGALESIDNGITYLVDHSHIANTPDHADAAIQGLKDSKVRAVFCYANYANPAWEGSYTDRAREEENKDWRLDDLKRVKDAHFASTEPTDLVCFGFAPSEPDITPIDKLVDEFNLARSLGASIITAHISLGKYDPGNAIIRQMEEKGILGPDVLVSHGNSLHDDELDAIQRCGGGISTTPDTELQMGLSSTIAFKAKQHGCHAALGVDICSNSAADLFPQMRLLLQSQRYLDNERSQGPPLNITAKCHEVLEMATLGGARAVGLEKYIGSITPGKLADLIMVRCDSPKFVPIHDPVGALVLYANGSDIDTVFINGERLKSEGKLVHVDWPALREELRASSDAVLEKSKQAPVKDLQAARDAIVKMFAPKDTRGQ